ncbi:hypothetical protein CFP65_5359 [Kitasatospora sp. MMS16-BH015]|uniref:RHS repeat-associated core domain-containing protein n=1 Tax=Kitasatospora sp. MMS16-BH015 TaxID=2018025 RepID=UPI000CA230F6|nr:RHS repeat-associated core domain-containing protein [Kitasatospora sp. MMS16-BH015]AUG80066.1 hypothetical protein CFP65_5359 [Kitasatospora sp. MMS16-BH015]
MWTDGGGITTPPSTPFTALSQGACTNATPTSGAVAPAKTTVKGGNPYWQEYRYDLTGNRTALIQHDPLGDTTKDVTTTQTFGQAPNTKTNSPNPDSGTGGPHALLTSSVQTGSGTPAVSRTQYDAAGNTAYVTDPNEFTTLLWDRENKLETVDKRTQPGNTHYVYDADGNQLIRRYAGRSTYFFGADEITVNNNVTPKDIAGTRYYPMPNGITDVRVGNSSLVAQIADHHGTNSLSIDLSTNTKTRRPTDPFGNPRGTQPAPGTWAGDKGFVGGTKDDVAGYTNLGARAYDTLHGRFISPDPLLDLANPQQWNGYAYSNNDPVNFSDPSGLRGDPDGVWCDNHDCSGGAKQYADDLHDKQTRRDRAVQFNHVKTILKQLEDYTTVKHCTGLGKATSCRTQQQIDKDGSDRSRLYAEIRDSSAAITQMFGHAAESLIGAAGIVGGAGFDFLGGVECATGVLCPAGAATIVAGTATIGGGIWLAGSGAKGLGSDIHTLLSESHETGGGSPGGVFNDGDIFLQTFNTHSGDLDVAAEVTHSGRDLHLDDLMIFPRGTAGLERSAMGPEAINSLKSQISDMARRQGFDKIIISYTRYLKGGEVRRPGSMTIDLGGN